MKKDPELWFNDLDQTVRRADSIARTMVLGNNSFPGELLCSIGLWNVNDVPCCADADGWIVVDNKVPNKSKTRSTT